MRIMTVRPPWPHAIIAGVKNVENRPRNIAGGYRGPVAIHAGQRFDYTAWDSEAFSTWASDYWGLTRDTWTGDFFRGGAILGVVDLVDVHVARATASGVLVDWAEHTKPGDLCSPWAERESYHLVLANPRPLREPIPYRGALGLRTLDDDTTGRILAGIA